MGSTSREIKLRAKGTLRRRIFNLLMMAAIFIVAGYLLSYLSGELNGTNDWIRELSRRLNEAMDRLGDAPTVEAIENALREIQEDMPSVDYFVRNPLGLVLSVLVSLMSVPLTVGYTSHILQESRGVETHVTSLIFGFRVMGKALVMELAIWFLTALGSVLFIIPGIILLLRYSMAVMVLVDHPDMGPIACMKESGRLMRGQKWRYFKLRFSFILWYLASAIVSSLIGAPLLDVYLTPYLRLADAEFYRELIPGPQSYAPQGPDIL